ncbi:MAG: D-lyxose/D-mannose family sugar isomerase [Treponema sp.]|jgi:D-lyxose ketol-isomerase|nr:D-lyxose/D-mannose family sugar isomerase [Treponema sp.]
MRRSEINNLIEDSIRFIDEMLFKIPDWVRWAVGDWKGKKTKAEEIIDNYLGWDLTDFGSGNFNKCGLIMLTVRNGNMKHPERYIKKYAEKLMVVREDQLTPTHFHWSKMEDIINRGGGNLAVHIWNSTKDEQLSDKDVTVSIDGMKCCVKAGEKIILKPGQSVFFEPGVYHKFYGELGKGKVFVGEVSSINDDTIDNRFLEGQPRFPAIDEDEPLKYPLFSEINGCF